MVHHVATRLAADAGGRRYGDDAPPDTNPAPATRVPFVGVRDGTRGRTNIRVVLPLAPGTRADAGLHWLKTVWPITIDVDCRLPKPMKQLLTTWNRGDGSGLNALQALS